MRKLSLGLALAAAMMLSARALAADEQNKQQDQSGSSASAQELDKIFLEGAAVHGMFEQKLSEAAAQQASDQQVKQFAQMLSQDHQRANDQLKEVAQKIGANVPQQLPEMKQREIDAIKAQQGKDFDQAYLSCMKAVHLADVSKFADQAQIAKNQDVKQFAQQQLPTLQQHQQQAISLASAQGLPNPIGEAQTAGSKISNEGEKRDRSDRDRNERSGQTGGSGHNAGNQSTTGGKTQAK